VIARDLVIGRTIAGIAVIARNRRNQESRKLLATEGKTSPLINADERGSNR